MNNYWKNKKVLITGGTGFIGSHAANSLVEKGAIVTVTYFNSRSSDVLRNKDITFLKLNLHDLQKCLSAVKGYDVVLHFGAVDGGVNFKRQHPARLFVDNVRMTTNIFEAAARNNISRLLIMSSIETYPQSLTVPLREEHEIYESGNRLNGYAWSKRYAEIMSSLHAAEYGLEIAVVRAGNVYGPGDYFGSEKERVIPSFIRQAVGNGAISVYNKGLQRRSFIYVSDFVESALLAVEKHAICDPINIAGKRPVSIAELASLIIKLTGSKSKVVYMRSKGKNVHTDRVVSVKKAKKLLSFQEKFSLEEGLKNTIEYYTKLLQGKGL